MKCIIGSEKKLQKQYLKMRLKWTGNKHAGSDYVGIVRSALCK